jgi:phosphoglycolate phosphatase
MPDVVLFDLDGTLSDSAPGILASLRHAFVVNGLPPLDEATELALLGPPFYESLPPLVGDVPLADVIAAYRTHYGAGAMFDARAYDGVPVLLSALSNRGVRLAVATSKPERYAIPIVERLGLAERFETIGGDDLAGSRNSKALVIEHVLERLGRPRDVVMVGDRAHDVEGARAHGLPCIGAAWGYGVPGELEAARPDHICARPLDVLDILGISRVTAG